MMASNIFIGIYGVKSIAAAHDLLLSPIQY